MLAPKQNAGTSRAKEVDKPVAPWANARLLALLLIVYYVVMVKRYHRTCLQ